MKVDVQNYNFKFAQKLGSNSTVVSQTFFLVLPSYHSLMSNILKTKAMSKYAQCPNIFGPSCITMHYSSTHSQPYNQNMSQKTQVPFQTSTGRQKICNVRMYNKDPYLHKTENSHGKQLDVGGVRKQGKTPIF